MNCFWRTFHTQERGSVLISWKKVCLPKSHGGLGVLDIHLHNQALLMKFLHKFFNKADTPWVKIIWETYYQDCLPSDKMVGSFWWRGILKTLPAFKLYAICKPGKGDTTLFWHDNWSDMPLQQKLPELFSFAVNKEITLGQIHEQQELEFVFKDHSHGKHSINSTSYKTNFIVLCKLKRQTSGDISGHQQSTHQWRCTKTSLTRLKLTPSSGRYGNPTSDSDTRFSFGCYYMTELAQVTCFTEERCTYLITTVHSVQMQLKKH